MTTTSQTINRLIIMSAITLVLTGCSFFKESVPLPDAGYISVDGNASALCDTIEGAGNPLKCRTVDKAYCKVNRKDDDRCHDVANRTKLVVAGLLVTGLAYEVKRKRDKRKRKSEDSGGSTTPDNPSTPDTPDPSSDQALIASGTQLLFEGKPIKLIQGSWINPFNVDIGTIERYLDWSKSKGLNSFGVTASYYWINDNGSARSDKQAQLQRAVKAVTDRNMFAVVKLFDSFGRKKGTETWTDNYTQHVFNVKTQPNEGRSYLTKVINLFKDNPRVAFENNEMDRHLGGEFATIWNREYADTVTNLIGNRLVMSSEERTWGGKTSGAATHAGNSNFNTLQVAGGKPTLLTEMHNGGGSAGLSNSGNLINSTQYHFAYINAAAAAKRQNMAGTICHPTHLDIRQIGNANLNSLTESCVRAFK